MQRHRSHHLHEQQTEFPHRQPHLPGWRDIPARTGTKSRGVSTHTFTRASERAQSQQTRALDMGMSVQGYLLTWPCFQQSDRVALPVTINDYTANIQSGAEGTSCIGRSVTKRGSTRLLDQDTDFHSVPRL